MADFFQEFVSSKIFFLFFLFQISQGDHLSMLRFLLFSSQKSDIGGTIWRYICQQLDRQTVLGVYCVPCLGLVELVITVGRDEFVYLQYFAIPMPIPVSPSGTLAWVLRWNPTIHSNGERIACYSHIPQFFPNASKLSTSISHVPSSKTAKSFMSSRLIRRGGL